MDKTNKLYRKIEFSITIFFIIAAEIFLKQYSGWSTDKINSKLLPLIILVGINILNYFLISLNKKDLEKDTKICNIINLLYNLFIGFLGLYITLLGITETLNLMPFFIAFIIEITLNTISLSL